ncbi:hypothetical protein KUM39_20120 [Streptomyces sp. J2-1]|uniref:hypothetical protein n=1 Tax=Streptomyces corallincola TaxID=2851888 RepID=UPI001C38F131|nr:hypothetical protein [Streptomyces corallincola]MBV2356656.1 hypothetical protein [Streptomyces corallincola]
MRPTALWLGLALLLTACAGPAQDAAPDVICGTRVDPALTRELVPTAEDWHESSRVDRESAVSAPCLVSAGQHTVLSLRFSWRPVATDLTYLATGTGTVSGISRPRKIDLGTASLLGNDGAISQTPCRTKSGNYFTLTLQLPGIKPADESHRADIEKFMRAYFPATVRTLGCR